VAGSRATAPAVRRPPNVVGILIVATAALVATLVTIGIFLPALGQLGSGAPGASTALPDRITVCGHDWTRDPLARELSGDEVFDRTEADPFVVSTAPLATCPDGVATGGIDGGIATTVYAQTGDDAFVGYELVEVP
jgi:hypothetical protein